MFSLPKTYEVYQEQIDAYLAIAQDQVKGIMAQIHAKIPIGKKDQNGYHQTQNPSKARQLKQTKEQTNNQSVI